MSDRLLARFGMLFLSLAGLGTAACSSSSAEEPAPNAESPLDSRASFAAPPGLEALCAGLGRNACAGKKGAPCTLSLSPGNTGDDGPALRRALLSLACAGGGKLLLGKGTFVGAAVANPTLGPWGNIEDRYPAVAFVGANTMIVGAGKGLTRLELAASQPNMAAVLSNLRIGETSPERQDTAIAITGLTIDGNAAGQQHLVGRRGGRQSGLYFLRAHDVAVSAVRFTGTFGTDSGEHGSDVCSDGRCVHAGAPTGATCTSTEQCAFTGEGMHAEVALSRNVAFDGCEADGSGGSTSTGFSTDGSSDVRYVGCYAHGMTYGMGFTHMHASAVTYTDCVSDSNGTTGFNSEARSTSIRYLRCRATRNAFRGFWSDADGLVLDHTVTAYNGRSRDYCRATNVTDTNGTYYDFDPIRTPMCP